MPVAAPEGFAGWKRDDQLAWLYGNYGTVESRQEAAGGRNALASSRFRAHNVATAGYVSPEERAAWGMVNPDGGTWLGNALGQAAPYALAAGLAYAGGTAALGNSGTAAGSSGLFEGATAGGASAAGAGNLGLGIGGGMGWDWGGIINTGLSLAGSALEGQGARDAARASAAGSTAAIAENRRQYDTSREDMMPWLTSGRNALGRLDNPQANFTASPGYEFARGEGTRGIQNNFAARGGALSGNALRALTEFSGGLASGEYNNWWNQQAGLAGVGQTSAQNLGALGARSANDIGGYLQDRGNARASGISGQTNAYTGLLQNGLSAYNRRNTQNTMGL